MQGVKPRGACLVVAVLMLAALAGSLAGCGDSSTTTPSFIVPSTDQLPPPADQDSIAAAFVMFFDGTRPASDRIALLESGEQYAQDLETLASSPAGTKISVSISSISLASPTEADVKYSLLVDGQPMLTDQTGTAVLQNGEWKVAATTFQSLLAFVRSSASPTT
jgi:hypothetical protein